MTEKSDFNFTEEHREPSETTGELELLKREIERLRQENQAMFRLQMDNQGVWIPDGSGHQPITFFGHPVTDAIRKIEEHADLTARAEQAEAAIDLTAIRIMRHIVENGVEIEEWNEPCVLCEHDNSNHGKCGSCYTTQEFELRHDLRGLPQEGEGKE